jgi:hypothetical protein
MQTENSNNPAQKRRSKPLILSHHISTFGILNRNGLELATKVTEEEHAPEADQSKSEFIGWSMPEERPGYIQTRRHDFL